MRESLLEVNLGCLKAMKYKSAEEISKELNELAVSVNRKYRLNGRTQRKQLQNKVQNSGAKKEAVPRLL